MDSLYNKYRPQTFDDVVSQKSIIHILERQLETRQFKNGYLFAGSTGCGKTTIARILANRINQGVGSPIEIDAASNNGVDKIREIVSSARERSLDSEYKIIIIDEAHTLTNQSWQAFLKCLEEPPKYTIFIFCTTDPQKIPSTIINRLQRFNLSKISLEDIKSRLEYICKDSNYYYEDASLDYIAKLSNGGMRDAINYLEQAYAYSSELTINNVIVALGTFVYEEFFNLTNDIIDGKVNSCLEIINNINNRGNNLKLFIDNYLDFVLDLYKYCVFKDLSVTKLPISLKETIEYTTGIEGSNVYYAKLLDRLLEIKNTIKYDTNIITTIEVMFISLCRGI